MREIEQRLRAARPAVEASPPALTAVLSRIGQGAPEPKIAGWWRQHKVAVSLALLALVLIGAGGSKLLLASGKPLPPAFVLPANPTVGLGRPLAGSFALLPVRVADPAGGLPWGMRVIRTTRGLACLQAGRVLDRRLGGLGIGYAFKADGRFHPFLPADAISVDSCATVDHKGVAFQPGAPTVVTADGLPLAGENVYPSQRVHCDLIGQENWGVRCPQADLRQVAVGMLGPEAQSIRVTAHGQDFTVTPYGPDGAYLIVLPAPTNINTGRAAGPYGAFSRHGGEISRLAQLTVTFRDGSQCQIPANRPKLQCSPRGIDTRTGPSPTRASFRAPIHVRYQPVAPRLSQPLTVIARHGQTIPPKEITTSQKPGPGLLITFKAPVAAPNISSAYDVELKPRPVSGCFTPATIVSEPTEKTVAAGAPVSIAVALQGTCRTTYLGRVFFISSSGSYSEARTSDQAGEGPLYEVIANHYGVGRRGAPPGMTVARFRISVP